MFGKKYVKYDLSIDAVAEFLKLGVRALSIPTERRGDVRGLVLLIPKHCEDNLFSGVMGGKWEGTFKTLVIYKNGAGLLVAYEDLERFKDEYEKIASTISDILGMEVELIPD